MTYDASYIPYDEIFCQEETEKRPCRLCGNEHYPEYLVPMLVINKFSKKEHYVDFCLDCVESVDYEFTDREFVYEHELE